MSRFDLKYKGDFNFLSFSLRITRLARKRIETLHFNFNVYKIIFVNTYLPMFIRSRINCKTFNLYNIIILLYFIRSLKEFFVKKLY